MVSVTILQATKTPYGTLQRILAGVGVVVWLKQHWDVTLYRRRHIAHRDRRTERRRKVDDPDNLDGVKKEERRGADAGINNHTSQACPFEDLLLGCEAVCLPHDATGR